MKNDYWDNKLIFKLPVASTFLFQGPKLVELPRRNYALVCEFESDNVSNVERLVLFFEQTEAVRVTFHNSCDSYLIQNAYDRVINLGKTEWLQEIRRRNAHDEKLLEGLKHFALYVDDGPTFEFVCAGFQTETRQVRSEDSMLSISDDVGPSFAERLAHYEFRLIRWLIELRPPR